MGKLYLKSYEVPEEIFNGIIERFKNSTVRVNTSDMFQYRHGYVNKNTIYYSDEYMVCEEYLFEAVANIDSDCSLWKQVWLRKNKNLVEPAKTLNGSQAYNIVIGKLRKYYTDEEIQDIFNSHEEEEDDDLKQFHFVAHVDLDVIHKFTNCYKYDINGAHCDALCELFPKAAAEFNEMYLNRKINPKNKQIFNFSIGELCNKNHRKTYNWIVHRTTKNLLKMIDYTGGRLIYANTDGAVVMNPLNKVEHSTKLGEFKLEFQGDAYIFISRCYNIIQYGSEKDDRGLCDITGSCLNSMRQYVDLSKGEVVSYKKIFEDGIAKAINVKHEIIKIEGAK